MINRLLNKSIKLNKLYFNNVNNISVRNISSCYNYRSIITISDRSIKYQNNINNNNNYLFENKVNHLIFNNQNYSTTVFSSNNNNINNNSNINNYKSKLSENEIKEIIESNNGEVNEQLILSKYQDAIDPVTANQTKLMQWDLLHWAALYNHHWFMKRLIDERRIEIRSLNLDQSRTPFIVDKFGVTPLHIAVGQGHLESTRLLIAEGIEIDARDKKQFVRLTALHLAVDHRYPNIQIVESLLKNGANVNQETTERKTPIFTAIAKGHSIELIGLLLKNGASINIQDNPRTNGWEYYRVMTPFHLAILRGDINIVKLLIEYGGDVNLKLKDEMGETLLHLSCLGLSEEITDLLISKGADINALDCHGGSPLDYAISSLPPKIQESNPEQNQFIAKLINKYNAKKGKDRRM